MKVSDLKNGMVAEFEDGLLGIFLGNTFITYDSGGGRQVSANPDCCVENSCYCATIIKIIQPTYHFQGGCGYCADLGFWLKDKEFLKYPHEILWKTQPEIEEMTMEEVCKALGKTIKIVEQKD